MSRLSYRSRIVGALVGIALLLAPALAFAVDLQTLIVGGGPAPESNQVGIENNVRYLLRILPKDSPRTVLFADGDARAKTVLFSRKGKDIPIAERTLSLILNGNAQATSDSDTFRRPALTQLDGAARKADLADAFKKLAARPA